MNYFSQANGHSFQFFTQGLCMGLLLMVTSACTPSKKEPLNTLHLVAVAKIKGLDPIYADDLYSGEQVAQAYEGLLQYHYLKRPYTLVPSLAESMPTLSADGKFYTFKLKKGVHFQDDPCFKASSESHGETNLKGKGRELTAEDVVYSLRRLADPKLASPGWWLLDGKVVGLNEWRASAEKSGSSDYSAPIVGLKVQDRYTLQIQLVSKSLQFIYGFAMPFMGIVPHEAVAFYGKEFLNHPVGTGPFQISEYNGSSKIVWLKNPTYRTELYPSDGSPEDLQAGLLEDAGQPLPRADALVFHVMVEQQPAWLNFLSNHFDVIVIPKDNYSSAVTPSKELMPDLKAKGIRLIKAPLLDITHLSFNMDDPILGKNKFLRQALSLAYDEPTFIELFYNGRGIPAQGPIPPGLAGYSADFKNPYRMFNLNRAKQLLIKAGYPEGKGLPELEYATLADSAGRQTAEFLQKMLGAIGVKLKVNGYSWPEFQSVIKNRKAQMWEFAWGADYPDAENFLQLFYSKNGTPGPNDANYSNPEYDHLYESALGMTQESDRLAVYKKMVDLLVDDCPWVFGAHRVSYVLVQSWMKNYKHNELDHTRFKYLRVDSTLKK